jgi:hypothetical protein
MHEMGPDLDTARSANLYSLRPEQDPLHLADREMTPGGEATAAGALERLEGTTRDLAELIEPRAQETPDGVLANLTAFCDRCQEAISDFFHALFGSPERSVPAGDAPAMALPEHFAFRVEELQELQAIGQELGEIRAGLQEFQASPVILAQGPVSVEISPEAGSLAPELVQIREDLGSMRQLLQQLAGLPLVETSGQGNSFAGDVPRFPDPSQGLTEATGPGSSVSPETPQGYHWTPVEPARESGEPAGIAGDTPERDQPFVVRQGNNDLGEENTCAVAAQTMIINRLEENPVAHSENELLHEAVTHQWYNHGTALEDYGKVLAEHGHAVERVEHSNWNELVGRLENGEQAICSVNAGILWNEPTAYGALNNGHLMHNHAVWVSGVAYEERGGVREPVGVIVNDSGTGEQRIVSAELFEQSWATSEHFAAYCSK